MGLALQSLLGVVAIPLFAWVISEDRARLQGRRLATVIAAGLGLQLLIAIVLLKLPASRHLFEWISAAVIALQMATEQGLRLVFGYLAGAEPPFAPVNPGAGYILAFRALPLILVMSALSRLLYHWGVLQRVVGAGRRACSSSAFGIGGPLGTAAAAKVFLGMVEAPLLVRPYLASMGRGALFAAMSVGMATVAGTVMALYASILEPVLPGAAGHVLAASLMNAPGALLLARLAVPDGFEGGPATADIRLDNPPRSSMDAIAQGTVDGVRLLAAVVAMLVVMVALVALANSALGLVTKPFGVTLDLPADPGLDCSPRRLPDRHSLGRGAARRQLHRPEGGVERTLRLPRHGQASGRGAQSPLAPDPHLCAVRVRQSRLARHHDRRTLAMVPERRAEIVELAPKAMLVGLMATLLSGGRRRHVDMGLS